MVSLPVSIRSLRPGFSTTSTPAPVMKSDLLSRSPRHLSSSVLAVLLSTQFGATFACGQITIIDADTTVTTPVTYGDSFTIHKGATLNIVGPVGAVDSTGGTATANVGATNETDGNGFLVISNGGTLLNTTAGSATPLA
jgi:hypothetical protein